MNSKMAVLIFVIISAAFLCQKSDAFAAGLGNMKKRESREVSNLPLEFKMLVKAV